VCVGTRPACYSTIQAAIDAAHDGDTVAIAPGRYAGGVTVEKSVAIVGAGSGSTIIKGGGPVLTIGVFGAATEPTVSITGVTITGGVATSAPAPDGPITFVARGGGVSIPGSAGGAGATVTIRNSLITGNRATPSSTTDSGEPCGSANCPLARAQGGGIADVGRLTLINSTVTGNSAGVSAPNGRVAEGGGIQVQDGEAFTVIGSVVSNNTAGLVSSYPSSVGINADSGGIHVGGGGSATIVGSRITGNVVSAKDAAGAAVAYVSALGVGLASVSAVRRSC
jgi:hypothetical protein